MLGRVERCRLKAKERATVHPQWMSIIKETCRCTSTDDEDLPEPLEPPDKPAQRRYESSGVKLEGEDDNESTRAEANASEATDGYEYARNRLTMLENTSEHVEERLNA